jgi:hypothetical protein
MRSPSPETGSSETLDLEAVVGHPPSAAGQVIAGL